MKDWDPKPHERTYYRSTTDGQRGYLVRRNGQDRIRLDRPMEDVHSDLSGWVKDEQKHPLSPHAAAKIAFIADQALARAIGDYAAKGEWIDLTDKERARFMADGPDAGNYRDDFHAGVMKLLGELTDG